MTDYEWNSVEPACSQLRAFREELALRVGRHRRGLRSRASRRHYCMHRSALAAR